MVPVLAKRASADSRSSEASSASNFSIICSSIYKWDAEDSEMQHDMVRKIIRKQEDVGRSRRRNQGERSFLGVGLVGVWRW